MRIEFTTKLSSPGQCIHNSLDDVTSLTEVRTMEVEVMYEDNLSTVLKILGKTKMLEKLIFSDNRSVGCNIHEQDIADKIFLPNLKEMIIFDDCFEIWKYLDAPQILVLNANMLKNDKTGEFRISPSLFAFMTRSTSLKHLKIDRGVFHQIVNFPNENFKFQLETFEILRESHDRVIRELKHNEEENLYAFLSANCKNVENFSNRPFSKLPNSIFRLVFMKFSNLKSVELDLAKIPNNGNLYHDFPVLHTLENLTIHNSSNDKPSDELLTKLLRISQKVKNIEIKFEPHAEIIEKIAQICKDLTTLSTLAISHPRYKYTPMEKLTSLTIDYVVSTEDVLGMIDSSPNLNKLIIELDPIFEDFTSFVDTVTWHPTLQYLKCSGTHFFLESICKLVFVKSGNLETLELEKSIECLNYEKSSHVIQLSNLTELQRNSDVILNFTPTRKRKFVSSG